MTTLMRLGALLIPLGACVATTGAPGAPGEGALPAGPFGRVAEVPAGAERYLPAGTTVDDLRVRDGCLYRRTEGGLIPVTRGRIELLCNATGEPVPPPGAATAPPRRPA